MKNSIRQIFLSILVVGLVVNCLLTKTERRDKILGVQNGKSMTDYYVRLYFEHVILFIAKTLCRKWSERKAANRAQRMKHGNRKSNELKILSWNSGHTYLINQINEVK